MIKLNARKQFDEKVNQYVMSYNLLSKSKENIKMISNQEYFINRQIDDKIFYMCNNKKR